eukprot:TRINITY_DN6265_c0_g1_i1.p1 TRINITY_DN6265_c0_g1~~TRINITY_DN6265_c0_g1_i1.p1  ORF type:complete len:776 (-),score=206.44 TRINITY_DN6265_c0_g1_i1:405-2690(-)
MASQQRLAVVQSHVASSNLVITKHVNDGRVAVLLLNSPPVNALSEGLRTAIGTSFSAAAADPKVKAIVIAGSGPAFCAGADITEFVAARAGGGLSAPKSSGGSGPVSDLVSLINSIEASQKPVVAAIAGVALGGGLELALGCHSRVSLPNASLGLPEVRIGLIPGAGGTQRLPRLVPAQDAIRMVCSGVPVKATKAKELGLVDVLVQPPSLGDGKPNAAVIEALVQAAATHAEGLVSSGKLRRASQLPSSVGSMIVRMARSQVTAQAKGVEAPLAALEALAASGGSFADGMAAEQREFLRCFASKQSGALQHVFFSERRAAKPDAVKGVTLGPNPVVGGPNGRVRKGAVLGCGTMGAGIVVAMVNAGIPTAVMEPSAAQLETGLKRIRGLWESRVKKGRMTAEELDRRMGMVKGVTSVKEACEVFGAELDIVVEAVFEKMSLKQDIFRQMAAAAPAHTILATNTSSLNINEIAAVLTPEVRKRVVGVHFFSPAHVMRLLENIRTDDSSPEALAAIMSYATQIKKTPVLVRVCPGFAANRMLGMYVRQAEWLLEEGATPAQVDAAVRQFGFPMGPFAMQDMTGLDVTYLVRQAWPAAEREHRPEHRYCDFVDQLYSEKRLGIKSGSGYYKYQKGSFKPQDDADVNQRLLVAHSKRRGYPRRKISAEEIVDRVIFAAVREGCLILEEGVVERASDLDMCWVFGFGFPPFKGGPMHWANEYVGVRAAAEKMSAIGRQLEKIGGAEAFTVPGLLAKKAAQGERIQ